MEQAKEEMPPKAEAADEQQQRSPALEKEENGASTREENEEEDDPAPAFFNRGLEVWLERQKRWRSDGSGADAFARHAESRKRKRAYTPTVSPDELLAFAPLPRPVPLEEVVEVLAELWESEDPF